MTRNDRNDTAMGGGGAAFPETAWSSILSCPDPASPQRKERLNRLFTAYWRPVYAYVRSINGGTVDEGKDLTQAFFMHVLESDMIARYEPDAGRFRHFLKGALRNFLNNARRDNQTLKRGGGAAPVSLNVEEFETESFLADRKALAPDALFDLQWTREVVQRALEKLREALRKEGREEHLKVYETYECAPSGSGEPTYEDVGKVCGLTAMEVRNRLHYVRTRLRELVVQTISEYVATREDLLAEMKDLFSE